jgi:hypothetical protein
MFSGWHRSVRNDRTVDDWSDKLGDANASAFRRSLRRNSDLVESKRRLDQLAFVATSCFSTLAILASTRCT